MASITIRNIPESILQKVRALSQIEKRSMNNELLLLIERGLIDESQRSNKAGNTLSKESQMNIWEEMLGKWEDDRTAEEIIDDIYAHRTPGRNIQL
jgi:plasmid stability protein